MVSRNEVDKIKHKAFEKISTHNTQSKSDYNSIIFTMDYFSEFNAFKEVLKSVEEDLNPLFNNIKIKLACRRSCTIGN